MNIMPLYEMKYINFLCIGHEKRELIFLYMYMIDCIVLDVAWVTHQQCPSKKKSD